MSQPQRLPGMEDAQLEALHAAALEYVGIRDRRQKLTAQEVELKARLLRLMKESGKDSYAYDGVEVELVTVEETVKVKVRKKDDEKDDQAAAPAIPADGPEPVCRLCDAPKPEWQTTDGRFFYCERHSSNLQEGEKVFRILDAEKAGLLIQQMREPDQEPEPPRQDPLDGEGAFINARNRGKRRTR